MKWISFSLLFSILLSTFCKSNADAPVTFRQQHPIAWMHSLPTGEMPGWSTTSWVNFEVSNANVWNAPLVMTDIRNGKQYEYTADFEQVNAVLEIGQVISDSFAIAFEIPYAYRSGGGLDQFIDDFHVLIGNRRFNRQLYPENQNILAVKTDNNEYYEAEETGTGVNNINLKLKYWLVKWQQSKGNCPCGISVSTQTKLPVGDKKKGGTTGYVDQSALLHFGAPLFKSSGFWMTVGHTWLGENPAMKEWPRNKSIWLYEMNFDFAFSQSWGTLFSFRAETPFLKREYLSYSDISSDPEVVSRNRAASGWNSLVRTRGSQAFGFRYRSSGGSQVQLLMAEDWGIGPYDASDNIYSNGAPDVNFILQTRIVW